MSEFESGTTNEAALEGVARTAIAIANEASADDCHNHRNQSLKECVPNSASPDCRGPVAVCPSKTGESAAETDQRRKFIEISDARAINAPGGLEKVKQTPENRRAAERARSRERAANPGRYPGGLAVGHAPDSIWGPSPESTEYVPITTSLNSAIIWQSNNLYPLHYRATRFKEGTWQGDRCVISVRGNL